MRIAVQPCRQGMHAYMGASQVAGQQHAYWVSVVGVFRFCGGVLWWGFSVFVVGFSGFVVCFRDVLFSVALHEVLHDTACINFT